MSVPERRVLAREAGRHSGRRDYQYVCSGCHADGPAVPKIRSAETARRYFSPQPLTGRHRQRSEWQSPQIAVGLNHKSSAKHQTAHRRQPQLPQTEPSGIRRDDLAATRPATTTQIRSQGQTAGASIGLPTRSHSTRYGEPGDLGGSLGGGTPG